MNMKRLISLVLTFCLVISLAAPAGAASWSSTSRSGSQTSSYAGRGNFFKSFQDLLNRILGRGDSQVEEPETVPPTTAPAETEPAETEPEKEEENTSDGSLTLIEDETTVSAGTALRASTYALNDNTTLLADDTTLKYFPVTLYNYENGDKSINNATHQLEIDQASEDNTERYVAKTVTLKKTSENAALIDGTYYVEVDGQYHVVTKIEREKNDDDRYYWIISYDNGSVTTSTTKQKEMTYTLYKLESSTSISTWNGIYFGGNDHGASVKNQDTYGGYTAGYADWNKWTGDFDVSGQTRHGNKTYSGLVEDNLDANKNIVFKKTEAGIFTDDKTNKDVYTNVGLPFVYENGTYTFNANEFGAYFHTDSEQGTSSTPSDYSKLYYSKTPQSHNFSAQDNRTKGWFPFNDASSVDCNSTADYFFGMKATIPFTMTANGCINPNNNNSAPITFSFSGDDDVWVFIDGVLVLDIGGVRNGMDATIDFANNTWSITAMTPTIGDAVDVNGKEMSGTVFNDSDTVGKLNQTRESFAAKDSHELTIFYLERGAGSSNCKIQFNLPMKDSVSVKKLVRATDSANRPLDADTLAQINNRDFGFTLYKNGETVANANYSLLNENGQYISTPATDANGHFTLKNGQTAKFIGEIGENTSYYVVEDKDADADRFWQVPVWTYTAEAAGGSSPVDSTVDGQSMTVTATGADEAEDAISFTCTNIWVHQNETSISAVDDKIVIDYGLPVMIDVLANDTVSNGTKSIVEVSLSEDNYGNAEIVDGKIKYQLTQQLTGVEVLTYKVLATASSGVESDNKIATAKVYIIPATSMYYEENFSNMVTYTGSWEDRGTPETDCQEPGVVGTIGDSPYGSDVAYLHDGKDSNNSSKYVNTTDAAASFSYTFTGTGTTFFARTKNTSGYMRVVITDAEGNKYTYYRDTSYKDGEDGTSNVVGGTLYNIPVYTWNADQYGTYTVTVSIAGGKNAGNYGKEFWVDGIRVMNPLNEEDENYSVALAAYASDGESNMTFATLRDKLIKEAQENEYGTISWKKGDNFVVFTDTNGKVMTAEEYNSNGPKEEVYLYNGQSIRFSLSGWDVNTNAIYLGIKAPAGAASVTINGKTLSIENATDCYYDISNCNPAITEVNGVKTVTFTIEANGLISITNIKVTGSVEFTIINGPNNNVGGSEGSDSDHSGAGGDGPEGGDTTASGNEA